MSVLAPLFLLGGTAIALPIIAHLIRRRPRSELAFSSLMFLKASPPRLTKRSRLDHWPLLLIRALVILLIAAAFARPFLRSASRLETDQMGRRIVLMLDTSASMRRGELWEKAIAEVQSAFDELELADQVALVAFDQTPSVVVGFEESDRLTFPQRKRNLQTKLKQLEPSWKATDLGRSISFAADLAESFEPGDVAGRESTEAAADSGHLILISDLQSGSRTETLQAASWPDGLRLDIRRVHAADTTNAWARILERAPTEDPEDQRIRVRVANSTDAETAQFRIGWGDRDGKIGSGSRLPVQAPQGETRVLRMPPPRPGSFSLVLEDDDHSFDNVRYFVQPEPQPQTVLYLGPDKPNSAAESPEAESEASRSLLYYLSRLPLSTETRQVTVESFTGDASALAGIVATQEVPLVVVAKPLSEEQSKQLSQFLETGGQILVVLSETFETDAAEDLLRRLSGDEGLAVEEAEVSDYAMLSRIDFQHSLFAAMADPQFNDFTKIRFWSHRALRHLDDQWTVAARFDDRDVAIVERQIAEGSMTVITSGWQPAESQLALSSKFPPLMLSFFQDQSNEFFASLTVGESIPPDAPTAADLQTPSGRVSTLEKPDETELLNEPGIYTLSGDETKMFAVNLDEAESRTGSLGEEIFEQYGITLGEPVPAAERLARDRQLRDMELESRQKLWQWLLAAALVLLGLETWLSGWLNRRSVPGSETVVSA